MKTKLYTAMITADSLEGEIIVDDYLDAKTFTDEFDAQDWLTEKESEVYRNIPREKVVVYADIKEQEVDIPIIKKEKTYDLFIVPNGNTRDFARGMTNGCEQWGNNLTLDEVRKRYRELAEEDFRRDGGEWCRVADENDKRTDDMNSEDEDLAREKACEIADIACKKYLDELTDDPDPLNWGRIEWNNDLKWVTICEHKE